MAAVVTKAAVMSILCLLLLAEAANGEAEEAPKCAAGACDGEAEQQRSSEYEECSLLEDTELPSSDMSVAEDVTSPEECSKICAGTPGCKAWTYGKSAKLSGNCYLKRVPLTKETGVESDCCDSGTPCENPQLPLDPLKSEQVQRKMKMQADQIMDAIYFKMKEKRAAIVLYTVVAIVLLLGLTVLGNYYHSIWLAPIKPSSDPTAAEELAAGAEKEAVLTTDNGAVLATRNATIELPLAYAAVLGSAQWDGVTRVKYSYRKEETGRSVEICADVVEREREVVSPAVPWTQLTLRTMKGAMVRIDGEKAELLDSTLGKKTVVPIETGMLVCPLLHLDDRDTLARKAQELYSKKEEEPLPLAH